VGEAAAAKAASPLIAGLMPRPLPAFVGIRKGPGQDLTSPAGEGEARLNSRGTTAFGPMIMMCRPWSCCQLGTGQRMAK
jgi:hypothetical protein